MIAMKNKKWIALALFTAVAAFSIPAALADGCCGKQSKEEQTAKGTPEKKDVKYTCPMHPEVVKDAPGKCPKCGMNLVKRD